MQYTNHSGSKLHSFLLFMFCPETVLQLFCSSCSSLSFARTTVKDKLTFERRLTERGLLFLSRSHGIAPKTLQEREAAQQQAEASSSLNFKVTLLVSRKTPCHREVATPRLVTLQWIRSNLTLSTECFEMCTNIYWEKFNLSKHHDDVCTAAVVKSLYCSSFNKHSLLENSAVRKTYARTHAHAEAAAAAAACSESGDRRTEKKTFSLSLLSISLSLSLFPSLPTQNDSVSCMQ